MAIKIRIHGQNEIETARANGAELETCYSMNANGEITREITCRGLVCYIGEHNYHDDSDFYALIWDEAKGEPRETQYATTRGWTYDNTADVDATPEIAAKFQAWNDARYLASVIASLETRWSRCDVAGLDVVVVSGRKVPKGTVGRVFWTGKASRYAYNSPLRTRIGIDLTGIKDEHGKAKDVAWTYAENCRRVALEPEQSAELAHLRAKLAEMQAAYAPTVAAAVAA
jgi:hypothetical protein